jgi:hypothetical protein
MQPNRFLVVLEISEPKAADAGVYKCLAKNASGTSVVHVEFTPDGELPNRRDLAGDV